VYSVTDFIIGGGFNGMNAIAREGNIRAIDAASLGTVEGSAGGENEALTFRFPVNIIARAGSVGMIRGSGTDRSNFCTLVNTLLNTNLENVGRDIQWVVAPNTLVTDLAANGNIGVVQAAQIGVSNYAGSLSADADGTGAPGTIDLIDVTEALGTASAGGPVISAGPFGNVRYIHIAEGALIFRPEVFGGGSPEDTTLLAGQSFTYTDDSGANVVILPTREELLDANGLPVLDPITLEPLDNSGTLTILTYPIAQSVANPFGSGGGGLVLVRATSTRGMLVQSDGLTEIGDLVSTGTGPDLIPDPEDPNGPDGVAGSGDEIYLLDPNSTNDNGVNLRQSSSRGLIDVWNIRGNNFNYIRNQTAGEMVNAQIGRTATITANNIGWARSTVQAGMAVEGLEVADVAGTAVTEGDVYPYANTKNIFTINGGVETDPAVLSIAAREAIGNVAVVGIVQQIAANADGVGVRRQYEGINGAIYALGQLRHVDIGEGILPTGTGDYAWAGLFCVCTDPGANDFCGRIQSVVGSNADIRGDIVSNTAIGNVSLTNGSIINADIWVMQAGPAATGTGADLTPSQEQSGGGGVIVSNDSRTGIIDRVSVRGNGGIIGTNFVAFNIGPVSVSGGFGIINCEWATVGTGRFSEISADGYGVRGASINGGQSLDGIRANTRGGRLSTASFSPSVRLSEANTIDPFFGTKPNPLTDLHVVLGTTAAAPVRQGTSNGGQIDFVTVGVSRDMGYLRANTVRVSEFFVPNQLQSFATNDYVNNVKIVTGRSDMISIGRDAIRLQMDAAGDVANVVIGGSFRGSSGFRAGGKVGNFITRTSLFGDIYSLRGFDSIRIGTDYGSQGSRTAGSIGRFVTNGNLLTESVFTVGKDVGQLIIGGDVEDGALFKIEGTLGTKTVIGDEIGEILVV
jgi:hypothetical protein